MATKINFTTELRTLSGAPLLDDLLIDASLTREQVLKLKTHLQPGRNLLQAIQIAGLNEVATLRGVCVNALQAHDQQASGKERFDRYMLAVRIHERDAVELSSEEITLLKDLIGKLYAPLYVGQAWLLLDPPVEDD